MKHSTLLSILLLLFFISANGQIIITSAGTGGGGFSGDGGPATSALLYQPYGVTLDNEGNLYICDNGNRRVRKVSPAYGGIITTVAGNGTPGFSGDGFQAIYAQIDGAWDIAIDKKGNVFIADGGNHRIRKVSSDGTIRTFAGTGVAGYNGDGIPATAAKLNGATGICVDDTGNLIIADKGSLRIRKIDTFGIITTLAGKGTSGFTPDGCKADTASFYYIGFIRIDKAGLIYFTDNGRIRKISASGQLLTVAGNGIPGNTGDGGPATAASIDMSAFCIDTSGNIYFADGGANVIRKIAIDGTISRYAGSGVGGYSGDGGSALAAKLRTCGGVATTPGGDVFIGDVGNNRVRMVTTHLTTVVSQSDVEQNLKINPNPAIVTLYVTLTEDIIAEHDANILTIDGRLLMQFCLKSNSPTQIVINWPPGTYILKTSSAGRIISKLFTIF